METIKQKLIKLSNSGTLAQITILDSKGDEEWNNGRIYYHKGDNGKFRIYETDGIDMTFKWQHVVRLSEMTEVWETQCISKIPRHFNIVE